MVADGKAEEERVTHIVGECNMLAQKEYKKIHDNLGGAFYWEFCRKLGFEPTDKWIEHGPSKVVDMEKYMMLWDFDIGTGRSPDLVVIDNENRK